MTRHTTHTCLCGRPTLDATLCGHCLDALERDLGDIGALTSEAQRVFTTSDEGEGTTAKPLVTSRVRRHRPAIDRRTGRPVLDAFGRVVLEPEPFTAGEFGRAPSTRWDADRGLGREIDATVARQTATARRDGGRSSEKPLPFNDRAATVAVRVHVTLGTWVRAVHDGREPWPVDDVVAFAAWLLSRRDRIAQHPDAGRLERDVRTVVEDLRRAVDRPADRWYMGPCDTDGCVESHVLVDDDGSTRTETRPTELYADPAAVVVRCRACKVEYPIEDRRAWLLAVAEDQLAHAELIGRAAPALGVEITPAAVRGYAARGRIVEHGTDLQGRPLYRVGDVITVAQDVLTQRAERRVRAAEKAEAAARRRVC